MRWQSLPIALLAACSLLTASGSAQEVALATRYQPGDQYRADLTMTVRLSGKVGLGGEQVQLDIINQTVRSFEDKVVAVDENGRLKKVERLVRDYHQLAEEQLEGSPRLMQREEHPLNGRKVFLEQLPDGSTRVIGAEDLPNDSLIAIYEGMFSLQELFPGQKQEPGDSWTLPRHELQRLVPEGFALREGKANCQFRGIEETMVGNRSRRAARVYLTVELQAQEEPGYEYLAHLKGEAVLVLDEQKLVEADLRGTAELKIEPRDKAPGAVLEGTSHLVWKLTPK